MARYRDPVHGYIEVSDLENKIINSPPFQRLRNIKQLAMTNLVYHGAEHTRFGHSIGVLFLVTKAFNSAIKNSKEYEIEEDKYHFYLQVLRLIALTHDLGHAPFSHAAESAMPKKSHKDTKMSHEDFTEKIILETEIKAIIDEIGAEFANEFDYEEKISAELICAIYGGKEAGENSEYVFLKSFMDSELDCDKMDYLLRDSLFCGVNYGKYDIDRLISCLRVFISEDGDIKLAFSSGGIQAFEEFVLARYFMFIQVYFHKTRRYFDIMYEKALEYILKKGVFPRKTEEYLKWDDIHVVEQMRRNVERSEACKAIIERTILPKVYETGPHPDASAIKLHKIILSMLFEEIGEENFLEDSVEKMPHKFIPRKTTVDDEEAIVIYDSKDKELSTISIKSYIIKQLTEKINIKRLYVKREYFKKALQIVTKQNEIINKK